jgi:hypothetical protein
MDINLVIERLESVFYTPILLYLAIIISLFVQNKNASKDTFNVAFRSFTVLAFLVLVASDFHLLIKKSSATTIRFNQVVNVIYTVGELIIFLFYFQYLFKSNFFRRITYVIFSLTALLVGYFIHALIFDGNYITPVDILCNFELSILTLCSLVYFYRILNDPADTDLLKIPSFWIICGLFFYCIVSIPFFFIATDLFYHFNALYKALFGIHYIFLAIFFLLIAKAFSCKQPQMN